MTFRHRKKPCKECGDMQYGLRKGMCNACYMAWWRANRKAKMKNLDRERNPHGYKGEKHMYEDIWKQRPHVSFISGAPLRPPTDPAWVSQFAHVIPKGRHPKIKFLPEYVVLLTVDEHYAWDNMADDQRRRFYPYADWDKLKDLKEELLDKLSEGYEPR